MAPPRSEKVRLHRTHIADTESATCFARMQGARVSPFADVSLSLDHAFTLSSSLSPGSRVIAKSIAIDAARVEVAPANSLVQSARSAVDGMCTEWACDRDVRAAGLIAAMTYRARRLTAIRAGRIGSVRPGGESQGFRIPQRRGNPHARVASAARSIVARPGRRRDLNYTRLVQAV